jgi:hypothetical protein
VWYGNIFWYGLLGAIYHVSFDRLVTIRGELQVVGLAAEGGSVNAELKLLRRAAQN